MFKSPASIRAMDENELRDVFAATGGTPLSPASAALATVKGAATNATATVSRKRRRSASTGSGIASDRFPQRTERFTHFRNKELRLFPRRKMSALGRFVVVDQFDIGLLGPAFRSRIDLVRERGQDRK